MLEQFSEKELDDVKEGLRILKQYDDTDTLKNRVDRDWNEIMKRQYMFDRCEKEALAIENININKLREFFEMYTLDGSSFRKLSVHVVGTPKAVAVSKQITFLIELWSMSKYLFLYYDIVLAFFLVTLN